MFQFSLKSMLVAVGCFAALCALCAIPEMQHPAPRLTLATGVVCGVVGGCLFRWRPKYSMVRMTVSALCVAAAWAWLAYLHHTFTPPGSERMSVLVVIFAFFPLFALGFGNGFGVAFGKIGRGFALGAAVGLIPYMLLWLIFAFH